MSQEHRGKDRHPEVPAGRREVPPAGFDHRGKCDFCSLTGIRVREESGTEITDEGKTRPAFICEACVG